VATAPRVGRCESDESAAEDDVAESADIVRARGCTGSVAAECEDDVDGRRKIELENCLPGDADCTGVWIVRILGGDVDAERPGGGDEESWACAASDETLSGAKWP